MSFLTSCNTISSYILWANRVGNRAYQLAELQYVEHLKVAPCFPPLELRHVLPETVDPSQCHQPLRVNLPCVPSTRPNENKHQTKRPCEKRRHEFMLTKPDWQDWLFVYALKSCFRYFHPVAGVLLAPFEEISYQISSLIRMVWVNVEAWDAMLNNLSWPSMECRESRKPTGHCLHNSETKCFVKGWLQLVWHVSSQHVSIWTILMSSI